ncbi:hypothetical protein E5342_05165 [Parabacteroides distasonis]|uniref:Secreted protein n=1 Tax=Parabacteroides distasonis TaxID=823 RepID=A0A4S2EWL0_PARDI|nr:hypothetical protein E5342_05165 [Parabacteroides distasonis]
MNMHKITRYLLMLCAFAFLTLTAKEQDLCGPSHESIRTKAETNRNKCFSSPMGNSSLSNIYFIQRQRTFVRRQ